MNIFLEDVQKGIETCSLLRERAGFSRAHTLANDPATADLIVLFGNFADDPAMLLQSDVYLAHADKCAAYTEQDQFVPLIPGVYTSARKSVHTQVGRVFTYDYLVSHGRFRNQFVQHRPDALKKFLFTFQGGSTSLVRKKLFNVQFHREDVVVEDTSTYGHWHEVQPAGQLERQRAYAEMLDASHFVLCPRGAGTGSLRFFEVMRAGVTPVLIADDYVLPPHIDWDRFLIRVKERDIAKLPQLLEPLAASAAERGRIAREVYLANFADEVLFDKIVGLCEESLHHRAPGESVFRARQKKMLAAERRRRARYDLAKKTALTLMRWLHIRNPYKMNER